MTMRKHYVRPLSALFAVSGRDGLMQQLSPRVQTGTSVANFTQDVGVMNGTTVIGFSDDEGFNAGGTTVGGFKIDDSSGW